MTRKFGCSAVLAHPNMVWEESTATLRVITSRGSYLQACLRGLDTSADSSHTTRPCSARFSTSLPLVPTFAGTRSTFPRIALETVTMVRYELSKVVTDQEHNKQFFLEGSHV
jgi:hypothetical protein